MSQLRSASGAGGLADSFQKTRESWRVPTRVQRYGRLQGWIDTAERIGLGSIADEVRGAPVLDLGVGGGRTIPLMRLLTDDYVGLEWAPEMVELCQKAYPDLDIRQGDARDLSEFPPDRFKMVFFSYNGMDYSSHEDRAQVLREIRRVLQPQGLFTYSTLSKNGSMFDKTPWGLRSRRSGRERARAAGAFLLNLPSRLPQYPRLYANWWATRKQAEDHGGWAISPVAHTDYRLVHFTTVAEERQALDASGFVPIMVLTSDGRTLQPDADTTESDWFFVVARKTARRDGGISPPDE